jgi:hypothetical protein
VHSTFLRTPRDNSAMQLTLVVSRCHAAGEHSVSCGLITPFFGINLTKMGTGAFARSSLPPFLFLKLPGYHIAIDIR